jgi:hypothetical protein
MKEPTTTSPPQSGSESDEPQPDRPLREVRPEVPEGDALEQRQSVLADDDERDDVPATMPADASEADVLEQSRDASFEDESRDW